VTLHLVANGFKNMKPLKWEAIPTQQDITPGQVTVGKYPSRAKELTRLLECEDLGCIYMMRDPRDVLVSKFFRRPKIYHVSPQRWLNTAIIAKNLIDHPRVLQVKYENLLTNPEEVQNAIAERFNLEILHPFSECYKYFDATDADNIKAMKGARPLDPSRIGNWQNNETTVKYVNTTLKFNPHLVTLMNFHGYH
jgi:hypothetical protein